MQTVVDVQNLSVSYNRKKAFEDITFSVTSRQIIGIIGPNGAGKTTLIKAIMGLMNIDGGRIRINDQSIVKVRKEIAYVPQRSTIDLDFPALVEDVVMMGRTPHIKTWGLPKAKDRKIVKECLQQVGMFELRRRQIGQLSGGQQQRVFLARALAQEAKLFFLDEPFAGIDVTSENMMMQLLRDLRDQGKTMFVVHHDLSKAQNYFDSLILLNNKLIACGKREEVFQLDNLQAAYDGKVAAIPHSKDYMVVNC